MAILEMTLQGSYFGQECINRFHYVSSGDPAAVTHSFALVSAAGMIYDDIAVPPGYPPGALLARIRDAVSDEVVFESVSVQNLYDVFDFYETPFVPQPEGLIAGTAMSPTQALGFRSTRTRTDIRRGFKRFVGVSELVIEAGGELGSSYFSTQVADLATALGAVLTYDDEGNTLSYTPCIVGKQRVVEIVDGEEKVFYRKYATEAEQLQHIAQGVTWQPYSQTRTQNSRQYGRGR